MQGVPGDTGLITGLKVNLMLFFPSKKLPYLLTDVSGINVQDVFRNQLQIKNSGRIRLTAMSEETGKLIPS